MSHGVVAVVVIVYLLIMLLIGYVSSKRISSSDDFALAGRKLGPWLLAGTLAATNIGGGSSLGIAEKAFGNWGLSAAWYVFTAAIAFIVLAYIAPRLRRSMVRTISEFFERRYGPANGLVTAIIMALPMIGFTAVQMMASATILSVMTGWSYTLSVIVVSVVVTAYSVMGGLWSVTMTDFIQCVLILVGTALAVPFALHAAGGWSSVVQHLPETKLSLTGGMGFKTILSLTLMYVATFAVGPEVTQRYYAGRDEKAVRDGSWLSGIICIIYGFLPAILGLIALSMTKTGALDATMIMQHGARYVLPTVALQTMPSVIVGILFAALISATMSSADSDMLAAGTIISNDIYKKYINKDATDKQVLKVNRVVMAACGLFSLIVALTGSKDLITILVFSFAMRAGGAFVPYIIGHYWNRAGAAASMSSLIVGSVLVVLAQKKIIFFFGMDPVVPAILGSFAVFVLVAYMVPKREDVKTRA